MGPLPLPHSRLRKALNIMSTTYRIPCCVVLETLLDETAMGRITLSCQFALDVLCDKTSSLPVVSDHVSVRNWPPLLPQHVATERDDFISGMSREEDLDG